MTPGPFHYRVFGLRLLSELELPELVVDPDKVSTPDLNIVRGPEFEGPPHSGMETLPDGGARMSIPDAGDYLITNGNRIEVRAKKGAADRNVRLFLLGSAMGLLLHQRGLLPLHANAVEIDGCAVAFLGESGAGKSTLAAWFQERGHRIIADDVCVVAFDGEGQVWAQPGIPRYRLWRQSLHALGRTADGLQRSFAGDDEYDKWDVPVADHLRGIGDGILSDAIVGATREVRSVLLFSKVPIEKIASIALDTSSHSSVALIGIILRDFYGLQPDFVPHAPNLDEMLRVADAALLIGDPALEAAQNPTSLHVFDLAALWHQLTGLSFVFAAWVAKKDLLSHGEISEILSAARDEGERQIPEIVAANPLRTSLEDTVVADYLRNVIEYRLTAAHRAGLDEFARRLVNS